MFCTNSLPNDSDVRDVMAMKDLKEIVWFFNKCKDNKKFANWRDVKLSVSNITRALIRSLQEGGIYKQ